jgi:glycosyltransferase involved in cell wall biosynthesis
LPPFDVLLNFPRHLKLALSILCENPDRKTGLTTLFHEFVDHALALYPEIDWIILAGPAQEWPIDSPRVQVVRRFPANDRLLARLWADHFLVPAAARRLGATALLTVGFAPLRRCLPVIMHLFSLQHLHSSNRLGLARRLYRKLAVDRGVRTAALIVTNSQFAARQIIGVFPGCRERLTVSYEGLQHDQFTPIAEPGETALLRETLGLQPGYLLWVSNFYPYKQAGLLLEAYARLDPAFRAAHPLVMTGGNWEGGKDAARAQAAALGIGDCVVFSGWVDDAWLAPLYRQARLFVLASREETFGRCVVEAMACGTPCVVNDIPIMHEVTGGHAVLVDFGDADAAAAALRQVAQDDALRARLSAGGVERVAAFIEAILEILESKRAPRRAAETTLR